MKELIKGFKSTSNGNGSKEPKNKLLVKDAIFVRNKGNLVKVKFTDIMWLKGDGNYTTLVTRSEVYSLRNILKEFESVLPSNDFIRIHKSYIARVDEIKTINARELVVGKDSIPVGRTYFQNLLNGIHKLGSGNGE